MSRVVLSAMPYLCPTGNQQTKYFDIGVREGINKSSVDIVAVLITTSKDHKYCTSKIKPLPGIYKLYCIASLINYLYPRTCVPVHGLVINLS